MFIKDKNAITPIEIHNDLLIKRDDLFCPFEQDNINGGKLRQCFNLIENIKDKYSGVISCCSIYSPQAPITSAVAEYYGLKMFNKVVKNIYLVATAPSRKEKIDKYMRDNNININYTIIDLFHQKGFKYENKHIEIFDNITFHPNYEAKTFYWLKNNIDYHKEKTLLWVIGSEPKI